MPVLSGQQGHVLAPVSTTSGDDFAKIGAGIGNPHPLAKAAIVSKSIDDYARVALLRAFEKEPRLLAAVDHIAQRRAKSAGPMTAESHN